MERFRSRILKTVFSNRTKEAKPKLSKPESNVFSAKTKEKDNSVKVSKSTSPLTPAEIQLLLDNLVYPEDMNCDEIELKENAPQDSTNEKNEYYSKEEILCVVYDQSRAAEAKQPSDEIRQKLSRRFTTTDFGRHMPTFWRLKKKLQKIEKMYPELYYRNQNIIEVFANSDVSSTRSNSAVMRFDAENVGEFAWI